MKDRQFENEVLQQTCEVCKANNLQVWTFESSGSIKQIFITDGVNIGTCSAEWSGIRFGTVHKPNQITGTGASIQDYHDPIYEVSINDILESFKFCPNWMQHDKRQTLSIKKWESWQEYTNNSIHGILNYYQL